MFTLERNIKIEFHIVLKKNDWYLNISDEKTPGCNTLTDTPVSHISLITIPTNVFDYF